MKVSVDRDRCQGHGMCNLICSEVFRLDDEGFAQVAAEYERVPGAFEDTVRLAEVQCPERAIAVSDDD
ncbi:MAG: ferredoxin [Pseudomonadota bacterium]